MWCCGSTFLGSVVSDFTKCTIKRICELIMPLAYRLSKIQQVCVARMELFYPFLRCEENGTALRESVYLEYFGGHSRLLGVIRLDLIAY